MAKKVFKGLKQVTYGALTADGTMPVTMTKIGIVTDAGVTFDEAEPNVEDLKECGNINPVAQNVTPGKVGFKFSMMVTSAADLAVVRGGTVTSTKWEPGETFVLPEMAITIETPTVGAKIEIPRASVYGKLAGELGDKGQLLLECSVTPLDPGFTGKRPYSISLPA